MKTIVLIFSFHLLYYGYSFDPCSENHKLVTEFTHNDCDEGYFYQQSGNSIHNCFPTCIQNYDITLTECNPNACPPGYYCPKPANDNDPTYCQIDEKSCLKYEAGDVKNNPWKKSLWKPKCLADGTWAPKQCKGEAITGRCFCFDSIGNRIFGQEFVQNANNMTCACSRRRAELLKQKGSRFYVSLHCDFVGNYEPLQCDSGQCWCVDHMTGEMTAKIVPENAISLLPCYSKINIGERYLRQCESEEYAKAMIVKEFNNHGTDYVNFQHVLCDPDGSYGPYQIADGSVLCTWKDKTSLTYSSSSGTEEHVNCNCARDKKIHALAGVKQELICASNGNYRPEQRNNKKKWFCVDSDGFRKSEYFDDTPTNCNDYLQ